MKTKSTQSRGGVKGGDFVPFHLPLAGSRDSAPCGVWGNAPTVPRQTYSKEEVKQSRGSEASRAQTSRVLRRAPSCSIHRLCCVAPDGRDHDAGLATIAAFSRKQGDFTPMTAAPRALWGAKSVLLMQSLAVLRRKERQLDAFDAFLYQMRLAKQGNMM